MFMQSSALRLSAELSSSSPAGRRYYIWRTVFPLSKNCLISCYAFLASQILLSKKWGMTKWTREEYVEVGSSAYPYRMCFFGLLFSQLFTLSLSLHIHQFRAVRMAGCRAQAMLPNSVHQKGHWKQASVKNCEHKA